MSSSRIGHIVLRKRVVQGDWKLADTKNNGRKYLVKALWEAKERPIVDPEWAFEPRGGHTPVLETGKGGTEIASFTEEASQDRHRHHACTEIYTVLKGKLKIFIEDQGPIELTAGDEIVILPGTVHEVLQELPLRARARNPEEKEPDLLVRVHALQCYGEEDKFVQLEKGGEWLCWEGLPDQQKRSAYKMQATPMS